MAMVAAMFANGGTCYYPRLIDRVVDQGGQDVVDPETGKLVAQGPRVRCNLETDLNLKPDQIEHVRRGMWKVVNDPGGTAPHARLKDVELAGKTGTAQFWRNGVSDNHTWFICFAPYQKPKYAICVFIQGAKGGGITAGPLAAHIMEQALALDANKLVVNVRPLPPAKGSFAFINNIEYVNNVPVVQTAASAQDAEKKKFVNKKSAADNEIVDDDETPPPADSDSGDRNVDHDRVATAKPKLRDTSDDARVPSSPAARAPATRRSRSPCGNFSDATPTATAARTTTRRRRKPYANNKKLNNNANSNFPPASLRSRPHPRSAKSSWVCSEFCLTDAPPGPAVDGDLRAPYRRAPSSVAPGGRHPLLRGTPHFFLLPSSYPNLHGFLPFIPLRICYSTHPFHD